MPLTWRALRAPVANPWLAGRVGLLRPSAPLLMQAAAPKRMKPTVPKRDPFSAAAGFGFYPTVLPMMAATIFLGAGGITGAPWIIIALLVLFLKFYGMRLSDYDRGQLFSLNRSADVLAPVNAVKVRWDLRAWTGLSDTWYNAYDVEEVEAGNAPGYAVAADGSVEPTAISPGGLAAYHFINSSSLRQDMILHTRDYMDSWVRKSHLFLLMPTWFIGATQQQHARPRTIVGDWTDENFPASRSNMWAFQSPFNNITA